MIPQPAEITQFIFDQPLSHYVRACRSIQAVKKFIINYLFRINYSGRRALWRLFVGHENNLRPLRLKRAMKEEV